MKQEKLWELFCMTGGPRVPLPAWGDLQHTVERIPGTEAEQCTMGHWTRLLTAYLQTLLCCMATTGQVIVCRSQKNNVLCICYSHYTFCTSLNADAQNVAQGSSVNVPGPLLVWRLPQVYIGSAWPSAVLGILILRRYHTTWGIGLALLGLAQWRESYGHSISVTSPMHTLCPWSLQQYREHMHGTNLSSACIL